MQRTGFFEDLISSARLRRSFEACRLFFEPARCTHDKALVFHLVFHLGFDANGPRVIEARAPADRLSALARAGLG